MSTEKSCDTLRVHASAPSAPPILHEERQSSNAEPSVSGRREPSHVVGEQFNHVYRGTIQDSVPFNVPPPSYQMAISCPTTPFPSDAIPPAPPAAYACYPPKPAFPVQPNQAPIYNATNTVGNQLPQPQGTASAQVVVAVSNGFICPHCNVGVITKETDMCCMLCLILLTIFTFPLGLVFLCCLPCTISRRCSNCRRSAWMSGCCPYLALLTFHQRMNDFRLGVFAILARICIPFFQSILCHCLFNSL